MSRPRAEWLAAAALLAACSSAPVIKDEDGFPAASVVPPDLEQIADATPKPEPRSRYGNPADYEIAGQRYFVLNSAAGYKERGRASWYGTKFNGRRTSSGETYDMFQMTAAHKTLPLPTYVRVTRLSSGKSVIVKVNDRGPFHQGRIIDLSYAAALKLDLLKEGSAEVEVEALDPVSPPVATGAATPAFLEVAVTDDPIYAIALREELAGLGIGAVEIRTIEQGSDLMHRVIAGPFRDARGLAAARQRLAADHPEARPVSN